VSKPSRDDRARFLRDRVTVVGLRQSPLRDLYHLLLTISWSRLILMLVLLYVAVNGMFASLYMLDPEGLEHARTGSFLDAFFFSVQTMATIGYGRMTPLSIYANILVTVEALVGMLSMAMATGLMFAKFSRPTARVIFSKNLVIHNRDGVRSLVVRMANQRGNQVVEAQCRMVMLRGEVTKEGEKLRRQIDLKLVRSSTAVFALSWTAYHQITEGSPLYGMTEEQVHNSDIEILVSLIGIDETFAQTVQARWQFFADEIVFDHRHADVLDRKPDGTVKLDYTRFHDLVPAPHP
jgi:inward rectifier potassium channel